MSWDKGFNFRNTSAYVTDGTNETYVLSTDSYPTTRNGVTFGWVAGVTGSDRDSNNDRRLAGIIYGTQPIDFQVDLASAGDYITHLSVGDVADGSGDHATATIKDNATTLFSVTNTRTPANRFTDATNVQYTNITWPTSELGVQKTFASTTFIDTMTSSDGFWTLTHIFISQASAAAAAIPFNRNVGHRPWAFAPGVAR